MPSINQILLSFFIVLQTLAIGILPGIVHEPIIEQLEVNDCLLPEDHPLQKRLKNLFKDRHMFKSPRHFNNAGFHSFNSCRDKKIMVARHPAIKQYLIKKFRDFVPQRDQLTNYLNRIRGARALRGFIELNNIEHIVVPQKWLYALPENFSDSKTGEATYLLIVEEIDICKGRGKFDGETARKYHNIDNKTLEELCWVVYYFRGLDSSPSNMPFTHQDQIAFIDTECWIEEDREGFLPRIMPYLTPKNQMHALEIFKELCEQDPKPEVCPQCQKL